MENQFFSLHFYQAFYFLCLWYIFQSGLFLKSHLSKDKAYKPYPCSDETLKRAHSEKYIKDIKNKTLDKNGVKKIGFPLVDSVVQRSLVATGGTVLAAKLSINNGLACNTAGGSHHANFDGCLLYTSDAADE